MLDRLTQAIQDAVWYNSLQPYVKEWISALERSNLSDYLCPCPTSYEVLCEHQDLQFLWMMCVLMFGDYGVSPRVGWLELENKEETIKFLKNLVTD